MSAFALASELPVCSYRIKAQAERARETGAGGERALSALAMLTCAAAAGRLGEKPTALSSRRNPALGQNLKCSPGLRETLAYN